MPQLVNERFFKVYRYLLDQGTITTKKEFSQACGFPDTHFNGYLQGTRHISLKHITNLYTHFGVSLTYMVIGKEPMMDKDAQKEIAPELLKQLETERKKARAGGKAIGSRKTKERRPATVD